MDNLSYQETVIEAVKELYAMSISFLPNLIAAILVLILGWLLAMFLAKVVLKILELVKIDQLAQSLGLGNLSEKVGHKLSLAKFGSWLIKWFFFLGSFIAAADILNLSEVSRFLYEDVLGYAGHVIIAMAILLLGILAANFFSNIISASVKASGWHGGNSLGVMTKWAIVVFTVIASLSQLQIASDFLQDLFRAVIAMLAIAGGIAFGLGGRDHAKKALDNLENDLSQK